MGDEVTLAKIETRMASGEPFTYGQLCKQWPASHRLIDQTIQKWRRKGLISFARTGRLTVWSLTDAMLSARKVKT